MLGKASNDAVFIYEYLILQEPRLMACVDGLLLMSRRRRDYNGYLLLAIRCGSREQHVKAGEQSHKNSSGSSSKDLEQAGSGTRGGTHEQYREAAGEQSQHKNTSGSKNETSDDKESGKSGSGSRGGSSQHRAKSGPAKAKRRAERPDLPTRRSILGLPLSSGEIGRRGRLR